MRRTVIIGVITFLLGAATSPRAANQDETLKLLCQRWKERGKPFYTAQIQRDAAVQVMGAIFCNDR